MARFVVEMCNSSQRPLAELHNWLRNVDVVATLTEPTLIATVAPSQPQSFTEDSCV